ncbi:inactive leucine-rich repeat receptor-like protein kinase CORYNE [Bidens hawaiensis]|uniref:inactive leucine-rich repeat receptor-like protein kinase CORYNE n=1 Tax=Bidens hawaiensis TaxID=980011 RepID=UPI00404A1F15
MLSILLGCTTGLACALVSALVVRLIFRFINKVPILKGPVVFSPQISPKSLQTNQTHVLISGNYYKTTLDNGFTVAVKKLEPFETGNSVSRCIQKELETLASVRHRHLMSLRAYVREPDRFCLVYDYVSTGSLEDAMGKRRENQLHIGWDARLRIAVGVIKALQYLHFTCTPRVLHYNLKPSNVLLDADFEPRLGDYGLAKVMHSVRSSSEGYYAPEYFPNFSIYTEKSDIFSFGVILGILLTGRDPSDPLFVEVTSGSGSRSRGGMGMWFRQLVEAGDGREALDKSLLGEEMEEDEMLMAVRIAAVCLSDMPADRPSSDELVPMLTQLHSF